MPTRIVPLLLTCLAGCSGIRVTAERDPAADFAALDSYAWAEGSPSGAPDGSDGLGRRIRNAVAAGLAARGVRPVPAAEARLLVSYRTAVEEHVQSRDPYYSVYTAERYEEGTLTLVVAGAGTGEVLWRGSARCHLRDVARAYGLHRQRFVPVYEEPVWRIDEMVAELLERFPRRRER